MRVRLRGINKVIRRDADGTIARTDYYHRASGKRLTGAPGTAEFIASFEAAGRESAQARSAGTVEWLIRQYTASRQWKKLADSTREIGALNLKACDKRWGTTPLSIVNNKRSRPAFLQWHESLADEHPRAADAKLSALARVFGWGVDRGHINHNPIATFERAYRSDRAEMIWLPEHVADFEAVASSEIRLAMMLALHTGQRQGDLLALPWSGYDGEAITLRQGKSGRQIYVPATQALKAALDAAPRRATVMLVTPNGGGWAKRRFHELWTEAFERAGIAEDLHFHDLRGTAVTMLAEAGCTVPEIATITGHSPAHAQKIIDRYLARTKSLAMSAIAKLDDHRRNRKVQRHLQQAGEVS